MSCYSQTLFLSDALLPATMSSVITPTPKFIIFTWGCQMNEDDSEQIASLLMQMGYTPTSVAEEADIAMLVTCSVRAKPEEKAKSKLGELRLMKLEKPDMIIGVCGCMAQRVGDQLKKGRPYLDLVVGTGSISRIPDLICEVKERRRFTSSLEIPKQTKRVTREGEALKSFVPVMYGCDNYCAYCVVPYVRGRERSRPLDEIVSEIKVLAAKGRREVTLLGQNVNSYAGLHQLEGPDQRHFERSEKSAFGAAEKQISRPARNDDVQEPVMLRDEVQSRSIASDRADFADLLAAVNAIDGIERIRFMTSHPKDLSDKLIEAMRDLPKVCEHIHLPIQSGDDEVLARMNRKYGVAYYRKLVAKLRGAVPDIAITTDFLIGFPGETDQQFENTMRLLEDIRFDAAFMFAYNAIPNTAAARMPDQVPHAVKSQRLGRLIKIQNQITCEVNGNQVGNTYEVLVEGPSPRDPSRLTGLTRQNKTVNFPGDAALAGKLVNVRATEGHLYGFVGEQIGR